MSGEFGKIFRGKVVNKAHTIYACGTRSTMGEAKWMIRVQRSEEHTSELQSHSFISYAVFCLKKNIPLSHMQSSA